MVKIHLLNNEINFKVLTEGKMEKIEIKKGEFKGKYFTHAIINNGAIILEGEESIVLKTSIVAVHVTAKSITERIAEVLQTDSVYLTGIDAIPKGQEREVIEKLF